MQSTQAQHKQQALCRERLALLKTLEAFGNSMVSELTNKTSTKQIDKKLISFYLASIKKSIKQFLDATKLTQNTLMTGTETIDATDKSTDHLCAKMEKLITDGLNKLKQIEKKGSTGYEETLRLLAENVTTQCTELKAVAKRMTQCILDEMYDVGMDDVDSAKVTRSPASKEKAEDQSLVDEPASSKFKSDVKPAVAESADEPDTMLSSATVSSAESAVRYQ